MPGVIGALVRDTAAALLHRSICLVVIGDCKYEESACSRYSADSMPVSSVQYGVIREKSPSHGPWNCSWCWSVWRSVAK
eukprot:14585275-Ditylum_brightwellii.AAC.1